MEMFMNAMICVLLFGAAITMVGMAWAMVDGRLWNNPGEKLMQFGFGFMFVSMFMMLVSFLVYAVQCTLNNGICPT